MVHIISIINSANTKKHGQFSRNSANSDYIIYINIDYIIRSNEIH